MRILLVETDQKTSAAMRSCLKERYTIDCVNCVDEALEQAEVTSYDLFIVDIHLPDKDGLEVCRRLRVLDQEAPILFLTTSDDDTDKIPALDAGVIDDYLIKPVDLDVLNACVRSLLRRGKVIWEDTIIKGGDVEIHLHEGLAYHRGEVLDLRRKEFLLLEYFLRHEGRVITRDMLLEYVWDSKSDPLTNTVDVHIKFLRDKVDKPFGTHHIHTIHGMGYKFEAEGEKAV